MTESLEEQLIRHEGLKLFPYRCSAGRLTIGVGHNIQDNGIPKEIAYDLLKYDIYEVYRELDKSLPFWNRLDATRQRVLANMAFNMGVPRLLGFKRMLAAVAVQQYNEAADEMLSSKWASQVGDRAKELAELMRKGDE